MRMRFSRAKPIRELEEEIARTQYNKATEHHIGLLKARIARLRKQLAKRSKGKGEGFEVKKAAFGWYKEFKVHCKGHPLAEARREC